MRYEPTVLDISLRTMKGSTEFDNGVWVYEVSQVMSLCPTLRVYRTYPCPLRARFAHPQGQNVALGQDQK